ncbi:MAG: GcrA family cell cycle regulator [Flavobacteriaceae bacterium]
MWTDRLSWTDERVEKLRGLLAEGLTASQIGARLGVTRNAVIGKVSRLGAEFTRKQPKRTVPRSGRRAVNHARRRAHCDTRKPAAKKQPRLARPRAPLIADGEIGGGIPPRKALPPLAEMPRVSLLELSERTCRWPLWGPGDPTPSPDDRVYCGHAPHAPSRYCAHHQARSESHGE